MHHSLTLILKWSSAFLAAILLTACPSPKRIDEYVKFNEQQQLSDKYLSVFNKSGDSKLSQLKFLGIYGDNEADYMIQLEYNKLKSKNLWVNHLLKFQEEMKKHELYYKSIQVYNGSEADGAFIFEYDNLTAYKQVHKLFKKHLKSIENGTFTDLKPTLNKNLDWNTVEELLKFAPINSYKEYELVNYSDFSSYDAINSINSSADNLNFVIFRIGTKTGSWLYFNYYEEKGVMLNSIDLVQK